MLNAVVIEPVVVVGQSLLQHVVVVDPASGSQVEGVEAGEVVALSRLQAILASKTEAPQAHEGRGHAELEQSACGYGFSNGMPVGNPPILADVKSRASEPTPKANSQLCAPRRVQSRLATTRKLCVSHNFKSRRSGLFLTLPPHQWSEGNADQ